MKTMPKSPKALTARLEALQTELELLKAGAAMMGLSDVQDDGPGRLMDNIEKARVAAFCAAHAIKAHIRLGK